MLTDVSPLETMPQYFGDGELGILHETAKQFGVWRAKHPDNADQHRMSRSSRETMARLRLGDVGDAWYINRKSTNPDLAWAFIEAFNSAETQAALAAEDPHLPARLDAREDPFWLRAAALRADAGSRGGA